MQGNDVVPKPPARRFGSALRLVLFYLVVVAGTLGVYFIFYVDARVDQTVVRNFRALDSAAVRLTEIISNLHQVASNVPVGIDSKDLDEILREFQASEPIADAALGEERTRLEDEEQDGRAGGKSIEAQVTETEARSLQLTSSLDSTENRVIRPCKKSDSILGAVQAISSISGLYLRDFNAIPTAAELTFHPLDREARVDGPALAGDEAKTEREPCAERILQSLKTRLDRARGGNCTQEDQAHTPGIDRQIRRGLFPGPNGIEVEARDCGSFSERSPQLSAALPKDVVDALDAYGVGVRASLAGLVDTVATNVAPVFDQFLIADSSGRVIFNADGEGFRYQDVTGAPTARRARLDFASYVNVHELVQRGAVRQPSVLEEAIASTGLQSGQNARNDDYAAFGIHSRIENLQIADIEFQAFIHPFQVPGLDGLPERPATTDGGQAATIAPDADPAAVLFMIGIADSAALSNESVRLRVSFVVSALLILALMVSLLSLLWLWTAGDRIMLKPWHPVLFAATGLIAALLCTLFVLHLATGSIDDRALDRAVERVSHRIKDDFRAEFAARLQNLIEATGVMLSAGEAPARLPAGNRDPAADGGNANDTQSKIERDYYCRGATDDIGRRLSLYPQFDLAFLLDNNGLQWQCLSYRLFDTRPIGVPFREYFQYPRDGRLWQSSVSVRVPPSDSVDGPTASVPVKFFLQRITSILDGTTETVLSARPDDLCLLRAQTCPPAVAAGAAAIIGRLHSLEDTILPPHFRFAVLDNGSGRTLFHSVGNHSLATNFIRDVEVDDDLLALVNAGGSDFVDLSYYGASIRAYVQPLADGVPWTLVTYRGYELADTLNIITVSTTAAVMFSALVLLFLLLSAVGLIDRWARARFQAWDEVRDDILSIELLPEAGRILAPIAAAVFVLLVVLIALVPNYAGVAATLSILSLPAALGILVWRRARRCQRKASTSAAEPAVGARPGHIRRLRGLALCAGLIAVATLIVLPTIGVYADVRARLGIGMSQYLYGLTRDAVVAKCERQTAFAARYKPLARAAVPKNAFRFGWTLGPGQAPRDDDEPPLPCSDYPDGLARLDMLGPGSDDNPGNGAQSRHVLLVAASGFSALGSDIVRRSLDTDPALTAGHGASLGLLLDEMLGSEDPPSRQSGSRLGRLSILTLSVLAGAGLIWIIVVSITDRVLGMRLRLAMLPVAALKRLPTGWRPATRDRLRACVIHRSDRLWQAFLAKMLGAETRTAKRARWSGEAIVWETLDGVGGQPQSMPVAESGAAEKQHDDNSKTLYVVEGFERFIVDPQARDALLEALEKVSATKAGILIWTRILPGIWLAELNNRVSGDLASVSAELALTARWSQVLGPFDVRRLTHLPERVAERFAQEIEAIPDIRIQPEVRRAMCREAMANPELLELAASVVQDICRNADPKDRDLRQLALQRFRASAASHFHTIWAASSRSERLQLLALAKGGFANPTQTITLSSLANRGLITTEGAVRLRSAAFKRFIVKDLHHDSLLQWRNAGHDDIWRSIWPPILLVAILATAFFVSSTPEALAPLVAILAAGFGIVPVVASMLRGMREIRIAPATKE